MFLDGLVTYNQRWRRAPAETRLGDACNSKVTPVKGSIALELTVCGPPPTTIMADVDRMIMAMETRRPATRALLNLLDHASFLLEG